MGTILADAVVLRAQTLIQDLTGIRWPLDEMLRWLNSGQRQIVALRPDAGSVTAKMQLAAGTRQTIPAGGWRVLDLVRNAGVDGDTPGRAIRFVQREILDSQNPDWHSVAPHPQAVVLHWTYDDREPRTFYVYPKQPSTGRMQIDLIFSKSPTDCTIKDVAEVPNGSVASATTPISLDDVFENPLTNYCAFRAFSKDATYVNKGLAGTYWSYFLTGLGAQAESDRAFAPQNNAPPVTNPNVPGSTGAFGQG